MLGRESRRLWSASTSLQLPRSSARTLSQLPRSAPAAESSGTGGTSPVDNFNNNGLAAKVLVFGGSGFVGQKVCQAALSLGAEVVSVNRSGAPKGKSWASDVRWVRADIFEPSDYAAELAGTTGVVSCVGGFGSNQHMERICGDATVVATQAAQQAGVPRFAFISAAGSQHNHFVLQGYWKGKRKAEEAILRRFPEGGVILQASSMYGNRDVGPATVPLGVFMRPLEMLLNTSPFSKVRSSTPLEPVLTPPVAVENVGRVAAAAALGFTPSGVLLVDDINRLAKEV